MKFAKILLVLILVFVLLAAGIFGYGFRLARRALPQLKGTLHVRGLSSPVTVYRDSIGVPHIYAESIDDVIFAQGYITAQDRLWQMDMFRRNSLGRLSEILGELTLKFDEEHCKLGFREATAQAVEALDPDSRRILERYSEGVNEFINTHLDTLPLEFQILHYTPQPWAPQDSLSIALMMAETLNHTWERDVYRSALVEKYGADILKDLYPTHSKYEIPLVGSDHISSQEPPKDGTPPRLKLDMKTLLQAPLPLTSNSRRATMSVPSLLWALTSERSFDSMLEFIRALNNTESGFTVGSNNWVVNSGHSTSGKPLLANDPHLAHSIPPIWYQIHLHALNLNVIGVSLAGAPVVIIGHNERIAWGMTNLNPDVQDVYVEQFDSENGNKYLANGQWIEAQVRTETIKIKDKPDEQLRVLVTRHGPVMRRQGTSGLALKWTAIEPDGIGFPFIKGNVASNWGEFTAALRHFSGPVQNIVYADIDGNIGLYDAGKIPIRRQGNGSVIVPGNIDDYEWIGYIPFERLPHLYNPPEGFITTANQRVTGDSYPYFIGIDWEAPYRFARIRQLLTSKNVFSRDDFLRIQGDVYSEANKVLAGYVLRASEQVPFSDPVMKDAIEHLRAGNFISTPDNHETAVIEYLRDQVEETVLKSVLGEDWKQYKSGMRSIFLENLLVERPARWLPAGYKSYNELLIRSLEQVCQHLQSIYRSDDVTNWVWGKRYPLLFKHPLGRFWPLNRFFNVGPFDQPGTKLSIKQTDATVGPSMRMVVDFAEFDHSYNNLTLGESGQLLSPYYDNQTRSWIEARSFPMHFTDADVKQSAINVLTLQP